MSKKIRGLFLIALLTSAILFANGCSLIRPARSRAYATDEAISLYVDAHMLNDTNESAEAIKKLDTALKLSPDFAMAHSFKGDIYQAQEQYDKSADAYEEATKVDPWSLKDFFNLGKMAQLIEQFTRAASAFVNAANIEPNHFGANIGAAQCFYELKEYEKAFDYGTRARELDAMAAEPERILGDVYGVRQQHNEAIDAYRRALELEGNNPKVMISLASAYLNAERYQAAEELLKTAIGIDPKNLAAYQYLGFSQLKQQKLDEAVGSYNAALAINAQDWMSHKSLGVVCILQYLETKEIQYKDKGMLHWKRSLEIKADQPNLRDLMQRYTHR
ncbi:MAG: tetratricopeptide repeat protein [Anaerohalosphaera sp.]|nr:tetratricopeptide repeat protein [Anaerohalosphaera sp.]